MAWLITGGAGYIGAHVAIAMKAAGFEIVILDDLSSGHKSFIPPHAPLVEGNIQDSEVLEKAFSYGIDGVIHLAGYKYAGVSISEPLKAYKSNVSGTIALLDWMCKFNVNNLVFSSSAAVYGTPSTQFVTEETEVSPESPYGTSKLMGELIIRDYANSTKLAYTCLRYFNVVGSGEINISDRSPHNLFPLLFSKLNSGETPHINGVDYPTEDGTCVRDYVHVSDIAEAHVSAAIKLSRGENLKPVYNLGAGRGTSVLDIMRVASEVTGISFLPEIKPRRLGDPARIVATGTKAIADLGWKNTHSLEEMISTAWVAELHWRELLQNK